LPQVTWLPGNVLTDFALKLSEQEVHLPNAQWGNYSGPTLSRCGSAEIQSDTCFIVHYSRKDARCQPLSNNIAKTTVEFWMNYPLDETRIINQLRKTE